MITREILEAQKELYESGLRQVTSQVTALNLDLERLKATASAFGGGVEAMDALLGILTQFEEAEGHPEKSAFEDMVPVNGAENEENNP